MRERDVRWLWEELLFREEAGTELLLEGAGHRGFGIPGVTGCGGFDERNETLFASRGRGVVMDAARNDEELTGDNVNRPAVGRRAADAQGALKDKKHLVLPGMGVPGKLAEDAGDFHIVIVELCNDAGGPEFRPGGSCLQ